MSSDKLTMQALKDHDKIHPKFKASKGPITISSAPKDKERSGTNDDDDEEKRSRSISTSDESHKAPPATKPGGMNLFKFVAATRAWQKLATKKKAEPVKPTIQYENTYRMEPAEGKTFMPSKAEKVIKDIFETRLKSVEYDSVTCKTLTAELCTLIKNKVKNLECPRYKIVCSTALMENKGQGVQVASRCIWNPKTDSFATHTYKNSSLIATAYVHAVYFE